MRFSLSEGLLCSFIGKTRRTAQAKAWLVIAMLLLMTTASVFIASADNTVKRNPGSAKKADVASSNPSRQFLPARNLKAALASPMFEPPPPTAFSPGDLVVYRVGDGSAALAGTATPIFLDEYAPNGVLVQSIPMPTTTSLPNKRLTASGTATTEGLLARSVDGSSLAISGYDASPGTTVTSASAATVNRVVGIVDSNANVDTTTALSDAFSAGNIRSAVTSDGNRIWMSGSIDGVRTTTRGSTTSSLASTTQTNLRAINIFNGQLYVSSGAGTNTTRGVNKVGNGLPTNSGNVTTRLAGFTDTSNPSTYGYVILDDPNNAISGQDTIYVVDDTTTAGGAGGLQKWTSTDGTNWTEQYHALAGTAAFRGVTGQYSGLTLSLFATTTDNKLVSVQDTGSGFIFTTVATASTNTAFRGVAFAPIPAHPTGVGAANPNPVFAGNTTLLTVKTSQGVPASPVVSVTADLSSIGGSANQQLFDDATNGDVSSGDGTFSFLTPVPLATTAGNKVFQATITDGLGRIGTATINLTVQAATPTLPTGVGAANPNPVGIGGTVLLTVTVTPGANPTSTGIHVTGDLTAIGGSASQQFFDDGTNGDVTPGNNVFSFSSPVTAGAIVGNDTIPITITDAQARTNSASISITVQAASVPPGAVVISQVYGGGGNSGATLKNDYLELFNRSTNPVDLTGWSLQHTAAGLGSWEKTLLNGVIQPGEYLLVQESAGAGGTVNLPPPDITGTMTLGATNGTIALVNNSTTLPSGICPAPGPNRIDLVGYGAGSVCFEGGGFAPTLGNTTAAFRTHNGCKDSDNNNLDFKVDIPNPRNSATPLSVCPIGDLPPEVFNTTPLNGALSVPVDSPITVQFDESVTVSGNWFNINCATTGIHTATFSGGPTTFTLVPSPNFGTLEQCTATIFAAQVVDLANNNMAADFSWSFLTAHDGSEHLLMGNPTNAVSDPINFFDNFLMSKPQYALSYNGDRGTTNWTSWHLDQTWLGSAPRQDDFRPDPDLPANFYHVLDTDYSGSGFDRGHMCPSADRTSSIPDNSATFLMTNMVPQSDDNNAGPWEDFENYLRTLVGQGNEIYIVSGPAGTGGIGVNGPKTTIANGHVTVPQFTWKVALVLPVGNNDLSRVDASTRTIAVITPNITGIHSDTWQKYIATIDQVKALTGYDFYSNVPVNIRSIITARLDAQNDTAPVANGQSVSTPEDTPLAIQLTASDFNVNNVFTFTITGAPSHGILSGTGASLTYTPDPDFFGSDTFTFKANDGAFDSDPVAVNINVTAVNDPPVAVADSETMNWNTTLTFPSTDLTANDNAGPNEGDQTLTVTSVSATGDTHGGVTLNSGTVSYTPDPNFFGSASFAYTVCDNGTTNGNPDPKCATGTVNVTVNLVDITPPVVTVPGDITAEAAGPNGAVVTFTVSANDNIDGPIAVNCNHTSGSIFPIGTTVVTCTATDAHNNTGSNSFNVIVRDTTPPSVVVPGDITVEAAGPGGTVVTFTVSATDTVDGPLAAICNHASGSLFPIGTTSVTCTASDAHNNTGSNSFNVIVRDTTPPSVNVPANITAEATSAAGSVVTFVVTANDSVSGNLNAICNHPSGSTFPLGTTTVSCTATDAHNNTGSNSFTVTVRDTTPPLLTLPINISVGATSAAGAVVTFVATATDLVDGTLPVTCLPPSGSTFPIGVTIVNCSAVDSHNNAASGSFTVTVGGARFDKQQILSDMLALQSTLTGKDDIKKFGDIVDDVTSSLNPAYWVDDNHLQPKKGSKVFNIDQDVVNDLMSLIKDKKSEIPDSVLQGFINRVLATDQMLAQIAINEATAAHGDSKKLAQANGEMSDAANFIAAGKYDNAVNEYGDAWKFALQSMNIDCDD